MKCLVVVLAIFAIVHSQNCKCPKGYYPEEKTNWCHMEMDYIDCNVPPRPPCRCPENFQPTAYFEKYKYFPTYRCVDSKNTKQLNCTNAEEVEGYINKYLVYDYKFNKTNIDCNCPEGMSHMSADRAGTKYDYCYNIRLPFRRIPCNLQLPPTCECNPGSQITQFGRGDGNLKCQHLFLKLQCSNDEERASYYAQVMNTGCINKCDIWGPWGYFFD